MSAGVSVMQVEAQLRGRTSPAAAAAVRADMEIKWERIGMETRESGGEWEDRWALRHQAAAAASKLELQCHTGTPSDIYSFQFPRLSPNNSCCCIVSTFDILVGFSDAEP